ncbi:MAG: hypothetical protein NZ528_05795 [Caldilineales bacterium]|nr:hypothetical protein [Caldilineales bacterium]MDW8317182.1 hypothetical protein [Anaerolineae bacterium]
MSAPPRRAVGRRVLPAPPPLTEEQRRVAEAPLSAKVFLEGPAGAGKTTAGVGRLLHLLAQGVPPHSVLVLLPQRTLAAPYTDALHRLRHSASVPVLTLGGLAQRTVELFWPLLAEAAGFAHPERPPVFLTLETAQYVMARLVGPLREEGLFAAITVDPNRLYSQILDNLNKAAVVGFPHTEIAARLQAALPGDAAQLHAFSDVQRCAARFREHCLAHNLLDFSLQVEVFRRYAWPLPICRDYFSSTYRHLIYDNVEEDTPAAHDLAREWLPDFQSALLIYDRDGGYREFLGADPAGGRALADACASVVTLDGSLVAPPAAESLAQHLCRAIREYALPPAVKVAAEERDLLVHEYHRYYPQMLDWVAQQTAQLVHDEGTPPREIVVLAPFLSDALRFSLVERLERLDVPVRSHRPSRALRDEPATRCLLTLAALAHPRWGVRVAKEDFVQALTLAIADMDLVRARLLAEVVFRSQDGATALTSFDLIRPEMHERITHVLGGRYEGLRTWLADAAERDALPLDLFLARLFGEVLSQPGYGFHRNFDAAAVAAALVESAQKFRWVVEASDPAAAHRDALGREYLRLVEEGVIAAQYISRWQSATAAGDDAVLLAPAHTFLMANRPVSYQFWLDVGSRGWFERLMQPLTHPYVLSRQWPEGRLWTDAEEHAYGQERLCRLAVGLLRRCRRRVYLGLSLLNEQGYELRGPLLMALHALLQRAAAG